MSGDLGYHVSFPAYCDGRLPLEFLWLNPKIAVLLSAVPNTFPS
jgi:hypothetical protein